ncbi:FluG domain-containing protein [Ilyonectria destructans]|nr:FluG domain-containing protein [Ilyonectria destructans]
MFFPDKDIAQALQDAAKKRHRYWELRDKLNQAVFISSVDADTIKSNIYYIKRRFMRFYSFIMAFLYWIYKIFLKLRYKHSKKKTYINSKLKVKFNLNNLLKPKSVFPTEDNRLDLPTIMLFQAYTACRPAKLVDGTKRRGAKDLLLEEEDEKVTSGHKNDNCDVRSYRRIIINQEDSETEDDKDDAMFDENDGYDSNATDDTEISEEDPPAANRSPNDTEGVAKRPETTEGPETKPVRLHKVLCYEDLTLWIIKNPTKRGRDVLAIEVNLRYHKGADRKPKPTLY